MNKYDINRPKVKTAPKMYVDYSIFNGKVRIVGTIGFPEIMDRDEAIEKAHSLGMNLVQIAYNKQQFPAAICKIIDYSKFKYEQKKKEKDARRASKQQELKNITFSIRIDDGDKKVKMDHIKSFLVDDGAKVAIAVKLSRREMGVKNLAVELMSSILAELSTSCEIDKAPSWNASTYSCIVRPLSKGKN